MAPLSKECQSNCNLIRKTNKFRHSMFYLRYVRLLCPPCAMDSERSLFMIVAILVIIAIRKAQRFRFIALNMYFLCKRRQHDLIPVLLARRIRRIRHTYVQRRRGAWVYPRPQGWFEEMYQNPVFSTLWKNDFRVTKETFDYVCQLVGPDLSRQNTRFRKAVALNKHMAVALWRMGTGNSYRTTGITFGQGKSTVKKICENFMEALICHKDDFIWFPDDLLDVTLAMRRSESLAGFPNGHWSDRWISYRHKSTPC